MSDAPTDLLSPEPSDKLSHEVKFYIALVVGLVPFLFLWNITTVHERPNAITVRPHWLIGVWYVCLLSYTIFQLRQHYRTEEPTFIPAVESQFGTMIFVLAIVTVHFCFEMVSVDPQKLTVYHPIIALISDPSYQFADLVQIELRQKANGDDVLLLTFKGKAISKSVDCDGMVSQVLPQLSVAAKAANVTVVGF